MGKLIIIEVGKCLRILKTLRLIYTARNMQLFRVAYTFSKHKKPYQNLHRCGIIRFCKKNNNSIKDLKS